MECVYVKCVLTTNALKKLLRGETVSIPAFFRVGGSAIDLQVVRPHEISLNMLRQYLDDIEIEMKGESNEIGSGHPI